MYLQSFLPLVLLCYLAAESGTVKAERIVSLAPSDEEAKLRAVQHVRRIDSLAPDDEEGIVSLVPDDKHMSSNSTEPRRRWLGRLWRRIKSWWRAYQRSPWKVHIRKGYKGISYTWKFWWDKRTYCRCNPTMRDLLYSFLLYLIGWKNFNVDWVNDIGILNR